MSNANKETSIDVKTVDLMSSSRSEIAAHLKGVEIVVSALNGKALESQKLIQDAEVDVGGERIYPGEYGMSHVYTQADGSGWIYPLWNMKSNANESIVMHPAISEDKVFYGLSAAAKGLGRFRWPPGERHKKEFGFNPSKMRSFDWYIREKYGRGSGRQSKV